MKMTVRAITVWPSYKNNTDYDFIKVENEEVWRKGTDCITHYTWWIMMILPLNFQWTIKNLFFDQEFDQYFPCKVLFDAMSNWKQNKSSGI